MSWGEMNVLGIDKHSHRIWRCGFEGSIEKGQELADKMMDKKHCIYVRDGNKIISKWDIEKAAWVTAVCVTTLRNLIYPIPFLS